MSSRGAAGAARAPDALGRALERVDRAFGRVENAFNLAAGGLVFALMLLGVGQIVLRVVFNAPLIGYIDIVEVGMVGFAVLSIGFVQRVGGHVRMELLIGRLRGRALWIVEATGALAAALIVGVLIPYAYQHFERALEFGDSTIDIELPTWPAKLVVPVALGLLLARLLVQLAGYLRLACRPHLQPVAVPMPKDAAAQARDEAVRAGAGEGSRLAAR